VETVFTIVKNGILGKETIFDKGENGIFRQETDKTTYVSNKIS